MELNTAEFIALFLSAVSLNFPESGNPISQPRNTPQRDLRHRYDFIIVGAGSAGCVVANRLSENPKWNVLLIEAGGDEDAVSEAPHLQAYLKNTEKDWNYTTVKQERACLSLGGVCPYTRGRVMGGSSTVNAMMYVRGNKGDYNEWEAAGNTGWSYKDVLPYFIKSENNTVSELQNSLYHGFDGYLNVGSTRYISPLAPKFIQAGIEFGWKEGDFNGENQERIGLLQNTMDGPSRESTSKAFLNPIRDRPNLSVLKHAFVTKLLIDDVFVKGVEYHKNGRIHKIFAKKEVIISAGSIDTPKLLMLSGIGPNEELSKHNIRQKADLPVGKHLQDHLLLPIYFKLGKHVNLDAGRYKTDEAVMNYTLNKEGPLTTFGAEVMTFLNVLNKTSLPDLQIIFLYNKKGSISYGNKPIITVVLSGVYPYSIGTVKLRSRDWTDFPLIDPNYFDESDDFEVFEKGFKLIFDYMKTPTMSSLLPKLHTKMYTKCPKSENFEFKEYIRCVIKNYANTIYHPVSTAKMGPWIDKESVVTPDLLVKGFINLRVIDGSVMPNIVRGNTNAPIIMIAEKGADIIKAHYDFSE